MSYDPIASAQPELGPADRLGRDPWATLDVGGLGQGDAVVLDGVLGRADARDVRAAVLDAHARGDLHLAGMGRSRSRAPTLRADYSAWVEPEPADPRLIPLLERFAGLQSFLNRAAYLGLQRHEVQLAVYEPGPGYVRHADAFVGRPSRRVTAIYYANPDWHADHGGALACWPGGELRPIEPREDRLVVFLSERLEHEVQPIRVGPRVAVTAWYWGP